MNQTTRIAESTGTEAVLHMALELGASEWKLGFGVEAGRKASQRTVVAGDLNGLMLEVGRAKHRLSVPESARVVSCYDAGPRALRRIGGIAGRRRMGWIGRRCCRC